MENPMYANNWRPTAPGGEPAMDIGDWRTQLQPDSRQRIVNKIMETLKKNLPFSGQEGLQELKKIAIWLEEKIYTVATSQTDYVQKLALKTLIIETNYQNTMPNSLPSNSTGNGNNSGGVWRTELQPDARQRIVNKIMETLKKDLPFSGQEGLQELKKIAIWLEENIYTVATSQADYLQNLALKTLTIETNYQNTMPNSLLSNSTGNGNNSGGVWRTELQPDARQRIVYKIMETLKKHLPFSGQEGLQELKKIAIWLEEKIYTVATSQPDYLQKLALKTLIMETNSQNTMPNSLPSNSTGSGNNSGGVWRTELQPDARQRIVYKIMETLKTHLPFSGQEGLQELKKIAIQLEEKIYTAATSQPDYL